LRRTASTYAAEWLQVVPRAGGARPAARCHAPRPGCRPGLVAAAALLLLLALPLPEPAQAQFPAPRAEPADLGLVLPDAPPRPGLDRRVVVPDTRGDAVVGMVHVEVGDHLVVLLPDGRLISVPQTAATPTERPFQPARAADIRAALVHGPFRGFQSRTSRRYVYVYNTSEAFATATTRILETMYPTLHTFCGQFLPVHDPLFPLVVVMFRTQEEFDQYRRMPEGVAAYYNTVTNHVVLYEQSRLAEMAPELAFKQSVSVIAHEGVHQVLHNIGVQQRLARWPAWLSEGLAEYCAPTVIDQRARWKGIGLVNDLRLHELRRWLEPPAAARGGAGLIDLTIHADALNSLGYASSWALVHFLVKHRKREFFACLGDASRLQPLADPPPAGQLFRKHFGDELEPLEPLLIAHLGRLPYVDPIANQTHYVALADTGQRRTVVVTTSPADILAFRRRVGAQAQFQVRALPGRAVAERFAQEWLRRQQP